MGDYNLEFSAKKDRTTSNSASAIVTADCFQITQFNLLVTLGCSAG